MVSSQLEDQIKYNSKRENRLTRQRQIDNQTETYYGWIERDRQNKLISKVRNFGTNVTLPLFKSEDSTLKKASGAPSACSLTLQKHRLE